jgi:hypothetical protein
MAFLAIGWESGWLVDRVVYIHANLTQFCLQKALNDASLAS